MRVASQMSQTGWCPITRLNIHPISVGFNLGPRHLHTPQETEARNRKYDEALAVV